MKLLIVTIDDYPHRGGKSSHIFNLISGLKKQDVECDVFSREYISEKKFVFLKLLIYFLNFISIKHYLYYRRKIEIYLFKKSLKKYIKNKKYDFVSFQDAITCGACGKYFNNSYLTMHTYFGIEYTLDNSYFSLKDKLYKKLLKNEEKSLKYAKAIICVDERIKEHVIETEKKYSIDMPIYTICNFTNTDLFKPKDSFNNKKIIIGCVRRLVEKNGVIYAVKAMKYLKDENCILKIYGEGPCIEEIKQYIKDEKLNNIYLCGGVDNSKMSEIYQEIDIVLVPSITKNGLQEATSISAIESMACGIPTIASDIGGLPLLIKDGVNGLLVPEKSPEIIANKVKLLMNNKKLYEQISYECRKSIVENNSHIKAANEYLEIFKN